MCSSGETCEINTFDLHARRKMRMELTAEAEESHGLSDKTSFFENFVGFAAQDSCTGKIVCLRVFLDVGGFTKTCPYILI